MRNDANSVGSGVGVTRIGTEVAVGAVIGADVAHPDVSSANPIAIVSRPTRSKCTHSLM
jgi:hypothetical protein